MTMIHKNAAIERQVVIESIFASGVKLRARQNFRTNFSEHISGIAEQLAIFHSYWCER